MRKKLILLTVVLLYCIAGTAFGADVTVSVDGKELAQKGVIVDGRTMVPIRDIAEAMGLEVAYENDYGIERVELQRGNITIGQMVEEDYYIAIPGPEGLNQKFLKSDVPMQNVGGKLMMPLKVAAEMLDADISWDGTNYIASVTQKPKTAITADGKIDLLGSIGKKNRGDYGKPMSEMGFEVIELYTEPVENGAGRWVKCKFDNVSGEEIAAAVYIAVFDKETGNLIEAGARDYSDAWKIDGGWIRSEIFYKYDPQLHEVDVVAK